MILYHFDLRRNIVTVVREGFREGEVWLSDISLLHDADAPLGPDLAQVVVDAPHDELAAYEVIDNPLTHASGHRVWCIPAATVNGWPRRLG